MAQQVAVMVSLVGLGLAGVVLLSRKLRGGKKKKEVVIPPDHGAFVSRFQILPPPHPPPPAAPPPLSGKTFAVKDIIDVEGHVTGFGNPSWAETHEPAKRTAPCIQDVLREGGATLEGKTQMDDMAFSILGSSSLVGQPVNPLATEHLPGGSSSGSAVAVAAGLVDFALGTDTAGSIRVPSANCGVLGYRPTHGAVSLSGVLPMSPSLDTVGVIAADPGVLRHVGHILLHQPFMRPRVPTRVLLADDLFDISSCPRAPVTESIIAVTENSLGPVVKFLNVGDVLARRVPSLAAFLPQSPTTPSGRSQSPKANGITNGTETTHKPDGAESAHVLRPKGADMLQALGEAQRILQRLEFRDAHGAWIAAHSPDLHDDVALRVRAAAQGVVLATSSSSTSAGAGAGGAGGAAEGTEEGSPGAPGSPVDGLVDRREMRRVAEESARVLETEEEKDLRTKALRVKEELRNALNEELKDDALLVLPVVPDLPPRRDATQKVLDEYRSKAMKLLALASMSGCPEVVLPVGLTLGRGKRERTKGASPSAGLPLSVGFMARSGADRFLLDAATLYAPVLPMAYLEMMETQKKSADPKEEKKNPAEAAKDRGNVAFKNKQYEEAVEHYTEAIRLNPRNATFYSNRAMAYLNLKNMEAVEQDCSAALNLDKKNVKALLRRGTAREFMGMYLEAYQDFHEAWVLEPTNKTAVEGLRRMDNAGVLNG